MAGVLQHLRSSTLDKRPNPASMVDGQVAINYASGAPGMFFKDSNGALVKVGPVHVGSGAPNVVPASGGTAGNSMGEQWLDTSGGTYVFKIWDGSAWRSEAGEFVNVTGDTMTGALGIIAGSAASPSLFISGDANTGLYSPGADQLAISTNGTGWLFVGSTGNVGVGTASPSGKLVISDGSTTFQFDPVGGTGNILRSLTSGGSRDALLFDASQYVYSNGATEYARIDSSGRLLVGTSSARTNFYNTTYSSQFQVEGDSSAVAQISATSTFNGANGPILILAKHRGGSPGGNTIVQSGDELGQIGFLGSDGSEQVTGASIACQVDGTPGANDMPGRLVFSTTADGASSPTERMRINSLGRVLIGTTTDPGYQCTIDSVNSYALLVKQDNGDYSYPATTFHNTFTSGDNVLTHYYTDASSLRGSVTYNRGGGVIAYNTTSDYRAKTILGNVENPGQTIDALKVYRGVMNGATVERPMLVAHEAQEVAPYCVTGEKDAVDQEGNPIYQQMDHQVLVPLLIAEIQQLRARVAALEGA